MKDGDASDTAVYYFEAASRVIALQEAGLPIDENLAREFTETVQRTHSNYFDDAMSFDDLIAAR